MADRQFFDEQEEQSRIKAIIVERYFKAWANVMLSQRHVERIAYIDLFAGPGRYTDGAMSTPLLILSTAINDPILSPKLRNTLVTIFNDKDTQNVSALKSAIDSLPSIKTLSYYPTFYNEEVGENFSQWFAAQPMIPSFFFVDPWGYKGLSLRLVNAVLKDWGSDCVFFFNYNRINMGLNNDAVFDQHMTALFGEERALTLRQTLEKIPSPPEREAQILENLVESLQEMGGRYVLPFRFRNDRGTRTTHYLIFVSKNFRGYEMGAAILSFEQKLEDKGQFELRVRQTQQGKTDDFQQRKYSAETARGTGWVNQAGGASRRGTAECARDRRAIMAGHTGFGTGSDAVAV